MAKHKTKSTNDLIQDAINSIEKCLCEMSQNLKDPNLPQNLKIAKEAIKNLKCLFIKWCLISGMKQIEIAAKLNVTPGRVSQMKKEFGL